MISIGLFRPSGWRAVVINGPALSHPLARSHHGISSHTREMNSGNCMELYNQSPVCSSSSQFEIGGFAAIVAGDGARIVIFIVSQSICGRSLGNGPRVHLSDLGQLLA